MADPFVAEIRLFPFNFPPKGWAFCNGQLLSIDQNTALFSLLGTTYGGDGHSTFALPNLQGSVAIHAGQGAGLSNFDLGQAGGGDTTVLDPAFLPTHTHTGTVAIHASSSRPDTDSPSNAVFAAREGTPVYAAAPDGTTMNANAAVLSLSPAGGNTTPIPVLQSYLTLNYCIALQGVFPPRSVPVPAPSADEPKPNGAGR